MDKKIILKGKFKEIPPMSDSKANELAQKHFTQWIIDEANKIHKEGKEPASYVFKREGDEVKKHNTSPKGSGST